MVRNLNMVNGAAVRPARSARKRTGPGELALIAMQLSASAGEQRTSPKPAEARSIQPTVSCVMTHIMPYGATRPATEVTLGARLRPVSHGRVVLIGAVHESVAAFDAILASPECDFAGVVTLTAEAGAKTSGVADIASRAWRHGVPMMQVEDVNAPDAVAAIRRLAPDLVAVVGWTRLIGDELLAVPRHGCVGFHASLLPRNRGRAPVNWAILKGEQETGNTMMLLNAGVDTGGIIDQRSTPIGPEDTCETVYERVAALGAAMLGDNLGPLLRGEVVPARQDETKATLLPKRVPLMGVTDWRRNSQEIHDWIRAQTAPYPGAFTHLQGERITLWRSLPPGPVVSGDAAPGTVVSVAPVGLTIATGDGTLVITVVGTGGTARQAAFAWAEQTGLRAGTRFDQPSDAWVDWSLGRGPRPKEIR